MTTNYVIFTSEGITSAPGTVVIDTSFTHDPVTSDDQRYNQTLAALDELSRAWEALHTSEAGKVQIALANAVVELADYVSNNVYAEVR